MKVTFLDYLILMFFSLLDIRKRNKQSHGKRKNGNLKRKNKRILILSDLSINLKHSGWHMAISRLVTLFISSLLINSMIELIVFMMQHFLPGVTLTCSSAIYTRVVPVNRGLYKYIKNLMSQNNKTFYIYQILYYTHNK